MSDMRKNHHYLPRLLLLPVFLFLALSLEAQEIRVNDKNEKIIVYPDGSWQYFTIFGGSSKVLFDQRDEPVSEPINQFADKYPVYRGATGPETLPFAIPEEYARNLALRKWRIALDANHHAKVRASEAVAERLQLEIDAALHPISRSGKNWPKNWNWPAKRKCSPERKPSWPTSYSSKPIC
jgi:hypothetical protein